MCYWRYQEQNPYANENLVIYRHYEFDAKQHYGSENVTNACSDKEIENLKTSAKNTSNLPTYESSETTSYSLKFGDQINQFPEIPYCKMQYEEVENQLKEYFLKNNIRLTIRKYLVETNNNDCYGLASGSNYSYLDEIKDGGFVEITVEWNSSKREFPTTIANSPNAVGNGERWDLYCDNSGKSYLRDDWRGIKNGNASDQYFYWGLFTDLTSPNISCVPDAMLSSIGYFFGNEYVCKNLNCESNSTTTTTIPPASSTTTSTIPPASSTTTTTIPNPGDAKNCGDFADYAEAKAWFDTYYEYYGDVANLDSNDDLIPCESLPGAP